MNLYCLPKTLTVAGREYAVSADWRDILEIIAVLNDPERPEYLRWHIALALFYEGCVPGDREAAALAMAAFIAMGEDKPGPRRFDWQQDAAAIISDVNRVAGTEIRALPFVHWWTFLGWFHGIGQGQLSTLVAIRDKLRRGKKLEDWEREFYAQNRETVRLRTPESRQDRQEKARLEKLLAGGA